MGDLHTKVGVQYMYHIFLIPKPKGPKEGP